jgi:hypothetical protein
MKSLVMRIAGTSVVVLGGLIPIMIGAQSSKVPKVWDEKALAEWATPVAGLNVRPGHFTEKEYYSAPVDTLRTYPVYYPGHEPKGYWEFLQRV